MTLHFPSSYISLHLTFPFILHFPSSNILMSRIMKKLITCIFCLSFYTVGFVTQAQAANGHIAANCLAQGSSCKFVDQQGIENTKRSINVVTYKFAHTRFFKVQYSTKSGSKTTMAFAGGQHTTIDKPIGKTFNIASGNRQSGGRVFRCQYPVAKINSKTTLLKLVAVAWTPESAYKPGKICYDLKVEQYNDHGGFLGVINHL